MAKFTHLHVHSGYSLKESTLRIEQAINLAVADGMTSLALTDTNALYGAILFYRKAKAAGIQPILGVQLTVGKTSDEKVISEGRPGGPAVDTAVLLAMDFAGYQALVQLVTWAHQRTRQPFVTFAEVASQSERLIGLVGGGESDIVQALATGRDQVAQDWLAEWQLALPQGQLYIDLQDHAVTTERAALPDLVQMAKLHNLPLVATNDVHYLEPKDAEVQRIFAQLETKDTKRVLQGNRYELASSAEMERRFAKLPEAIANTAVIAAACQLELPLGQTLLPKYQVPDGESAETVLRRAAEVGAKQRYTADLSEAVRQRLDYELDIICRLGFADYFLVVADFIRFAHKQNISTGPGRGSAASSLVAYSLRITDVDPLRNQLLFERFLNPERLSWPDIDTDFEFERRGEVITYVSEKYGHAQVAQIGTFGTLAARAAIRDSGRALSVDPKVVDKLAKLIPSSPGITLVSARKEVSGIQELLETNHHAQTVWDTAIQLEGLPRHTSVHAAGVVIAPVPLACLVPVEPGADGLLITQYPMEDIEQMGLLKMDFLGLKTLTLIDRTIASIWARTEHTVDWRRVPEDDTPTFKMLARGDTNGCFQLESAGVRRVLRDLKATQFDEIIGVISLYRPGPMENIPIYVAAKHGRRAIGYPHPDLAAILKDTYGVIVYQEQIMQIAALMAGFSLGQSDLLRRAVSKKKREVLDAERGRFVTGCIGRGYDESVANEVYDLIVRFADYGYPKSHAAAYAVLTYRTAYLRANYFADFLAALLTMAMGSQDKVNEYIRDAKQNRVQVAPPSVMTSEAGYTVETDHMVRTGLLAVRNVGNAAVEAIMEARRGAPFTSLVDFLRRVNSRVCNRKAVESLLEVGAFAALLPEGTTPSVAMDILSEAYKEADEHKQYEGLGLFFDSPQANFAGHTLPQHQGESNITQEDSQRADGQLLYIRYAGGANAKVQLESLQKVLISYSGTTPVALYNQATRKMRLLEAKWHVALSPELISVLEEIVGLGNARVGRNQHASTRNRTTTESGRSHF